MCNLILGSKFESFEPENLPVLWNNGVFFDWLGTPVGVLKGGAQLINFFPLSTALVP